MANRNVSVFLTPMPGTQDEIELRTFPDPVIANIIVDVDTGELVEIDTVTWNYATQPPPEAETGPIPQPPAPDQVVMQIRFTQQNTPYPPPSTSPNLIAGPLEGDAAAYEGIGTVPVSPNEPRLDAGVALPGEVQVTEQENGFEFLVREYKYSVILTTPIREFTLDPRVRIRQRHRRLE